ncbi:MAG: choice-of-anchor D domain-containing protein [Acidobacteriaceae bacterium]
MFYAAVQFHGYYQSPDGATWTRMANQPGTALSAGNCPFSSQSNSCSIFRGVLAVQPVSGDMFALTVGTSALGLNNVDQGLWQDVCNAGPNGCASSTVEFGTKISDTALDAANGTIPNGTYNLVLASVPNGTDTLLFAGTQDVFRCSLAAGCLWRNTTNTNSCVSGHVPPAQHAIAFLSPPAGKTSPLLYFGNDGGLWRSTDGVDQTGAPCASSDTVHYQNMNDGLGSLAEVTGLANSESDASVLLAGFGVNGSAAMTTSGQAAWPQLASGEGGMTAIDPTNPDNWYATLGPYVAIGQCTQGTNCTTGDFGAAPAIGSTETSGDQSLLFAPYALDPADSSNMLVGTCRVWRGPSSGNDGSGGDTWTAANAISPMLDGHTQPICNDNALIRSLAAGGANVQPGTGAEHNGSQVLYAGMAGLLDGGGASVGGHVFSTKSADTANGMTEWTDLALSPVANEQSYSGIFNPSRFDVSSLFVDPHDTTGNTIYATIQGFGVPHLYLSTDGGADWINITKNLPDLPLNDVLVDPNNSNVVYVASDGGVFVTENIADCELSGGQCWNILGTGLPLAPAIKLASTLADGGFLRVGTYGRGVWQIPLLSGMPQTTITLNTATLTFAGQQLQTVSSPQIITVTNTGSIALTISSVTITGDFLETDDCSSPIAQNDTCQISVTFNPSTSGTRTGTLTVSGNIAGGQENVGLSGTGTTQSPVVLLPNNVNFGGQQIDTTSATQQVTVSNTGTTSIALTSEGVTGSFAIQNNTCSSTLPPNTGCTLAIVFQPTQTGSASGVLTVVTGQGTETIGLVGSGENPATDTLLPTSLTFPSTLENTASAPQTITLQNSGETPLTGIQVQTTGDFQVVNGCSYSLNAQSTCSLTVRYTPHAAGAETGSITVTDNVRIQTIPLGGTGTAPATDTLSLTSLVFPATPVGHNAPSQTVTLTNSGDVVLAELSIHSIGDGFGETNTCGTALAAKSICTITVTFQATTAGNAAGQVDVADAIRTQVIPLTASGETPAEDNVSPLSLNFGNQAVGTTSAVQTITISNNGQALLSGLNLQSGDPNFVFTTTCGTTLQEGSSCAIQVSFKPHAAGADSGTLTITDASRTQQIPLNGVGELPNITLTPGYLDFGIVGLQISSPTQSLLLSNGSNDTLTGISIATSGPFSETSNCGTSLPSGARCSLFLVFTPNITGHQSGTITIDSTNGATMVTQLAGDGISFQLSPTSPTTVSVSSGNAASYSMELIPASGSIGNATLSCSNLPPNSTCTVLPSSATLLNPSNIQIAVATGVGGPAQVRRAGMLGRLPWPLGLCLVVTLLWPTRCRYVCLQPRIRRILTVILLALLIGGTGACGRGGGLLGPGNSTPLPNNSTTPPGTYTVIVAAEAGGLKKSVALTVEVR